MARKFAYYPGCVAEFSSKELNSTTKALAPLLDIDLQPMPAATCCGAGDVAEAKPNLYLTLNVRILSQAEEMGHDIMTICNVCTLNLRRANKLVKEDPRVSRGRQRGAGQGRRASLRGDPRGHAPALVHRHRGRPVAAGAPGSQGAQRPARGAVLRLPAAAALVGDGLRGPRPAPVAGAADRGAGRRGRRLRRQVEVLRLPDPAGPREHGPQGVPRRAVPGPRRRRGVHGDPVPAVPPGHGCLPAQGGSRQRRDLQHAGAAPATAAAGWPSASTTRSWISSATWCPSTKSCRSSAPDLPTARGAGPDRTITRVARRMAGDPRAVVPPFGTEHAR